MWGNEVPSDFNFNYQQHKAPHESSISCTLCIQDYYHWQVINNFYLFEIYQNIFNISL
jgi:hypothetical protein